MQPLDPALSPPRGRGSMLAVFKHEFSHTPFQPAFLVLPCRQSPP